MLNYNELTDYFEQYILHYKEVLNFEYQKLECIINNNVAWLSGAISTEQAFIMKTNSYEAKREKLLGEENKGKTFVTLIEEAPEEYKSRLKDCYNEISKLVFEIKRVNNHAHEIIADRMQLMGGEKQSNTYSLKEIMHDSAVPQTLTKNA